MKFSNLFFAALLLAGTIAMASDIEETPQAKQLWRQNLRELEKPKIGAQTCYDGKAQTLEEAFQKASDALLKSQVKFYKISGITTSKPQQGHPYFWYQIWITYNHD